MTTSCYCWSWRSLHRRTNAGIVWVSAPEDYAHFNSNHIPDGTAWHHNNLTSSVGGNGAVVARPAAYAFAWQNTQHIHYAD
jgi:hypothetical protein